MICCAIVRFYTEPENAPDPYKPEVSIVHLANTISTLAGIGIGSDGLYHQISKPALDILKISNAELEELYTKIPEMTSQVRDLL